MASADFTSANHGLPHLAIFPFLSKGHTIPLIQLVNYLRHHQLATVTFFTTPGNAPFVRSGLLSGAGGDDDGAAVAVVELEFPTDVPGIQPGIESAEGLTSMAAFVAFAHAVSLLRPQFEASVAAMRPPPRFIVADAFLYWTNDSAARLGVPKVSFLVTSTFAHVMRELIVRHDPFSLLRPRATDVVIDDDITPPATHSQTFSVPEFPRVSLPFEELMVAFKDASAFGPMMELDGKMGKAIAQSHSLIINTFHGLEAPYIEFWDEHVHPRAWPIGPLCLAQPAFEPGPTRPPRMGWLGGVGGAAAPPAQPVLYVALGTLSAIPALQVKQVADGLDRSRLHFLWAARHDGDGDGDVDLGREFEERTKHRGLVVREWVDQPRILRHRSVRGFLSHCGWNSVLESVAAGVPLAAWPMNFDQPFNARLLVDELRIAAMVWTSDSIARGFVTDEEISRVVGELMLGDVGVEAARNVARLSASAKKAMDQGGSSWTAVREMISEFCKNECA
uniref:Glycosyltransferase n=1 Tax=Oryza brachyantha TaxID=4533 RepID=J3MWK8_ORYBR